MTGHRAKKAGLLSFPCTGKCSTNPPFPPQLEVVVHVLSFWAQLSVVFANAQSFSSQEGRAPSSPFPVLLFSLTFSMPLLFRTQLQAFFPCALWCCLSCFARTFCSCPARRSLEIICWRNGKETRKRFRSSPPSPPRCKKRL